MCCVIGLLIKLVGKETSSYSVLTVGWAVKAFLMDTRGEALKPEALVQRAAALGGLGRDAVPSISPPISARFPSLLRSHISMTRGSRHQGNMWLRSKVESLVFPSTESSSHSLLSGWLRFKFRKLSQGQEGLSQNMGFKRCIFQT